ncbi:hypothetical protein Mnod_2983 [Methylobacterium nodulans ORS 2060]|uniref:Uncharacterized protein n=1 Tax=Methylobacterium nodulans (strain LMG 21967 / CNCM I-2342 / ORS 2060) TaxID=460265 RepID=B8II63_METNO|nr:hypothetical protein Mnod_2983 [Methylobacterium nodulans ORS 2060]
MGDNVGANPLTIWKEYGWPTADRRTSIVVGLGRHPLAVEIGPSGTVAYRPRPKHPRDVVSSDVLML